MSEVSNRVAALNSNLDKVRLRFEKLRKENDTLLGRVDELEGKLRENTSRFDNLQEAFDNLKMAKSIAAKAGDKAEIKYRVNELVREIDQCIALLNR